MPKPILNTMPETLEDWSQLCEDMCFAQREVYDEACAMARMMAASEFDLKHGDDRARLIAELDQDVAVLEQEKGASEARAFREAGVARIDGELERQRQEAIDVSCLGIEPPQTLEQIQVMLASLKPLKELPPEPALAQDYSRAIYQLADGRLFDVAAGAFALGRDAVEPGRIIELGGPATDANLRETLEFYKLPVPALLMSEGELFANLRAERDRRVAATDYLLTPDYPLAEDKRVAISAYRQALRDLPAREGAPWDGGGELTPWPDKP